MHSEHLESATAANRRRLAIVLTLTLTFLIVEVIGGLLTNSLALLADAAHMLTDVGGIALALFAAWMSQRPATPTKTYGYYRWEILAAAINSMVLFGMAFFILYEAIQRFSEPPEVVSVPMLIVAVVGLLVNLISMRVLHAGAGESLNLKGAYLEVVSDTLGSVGVILAAVIIWLTSWYYADPIMSVLISVFIFPRTWRLLSEATNVLLEGVPVHIALAAVQEAILDVEKVQQVHDLHIWTITSGIVSLSAHVVLEPDCDASDSQRVLEAITSMLDDRFAIEHATLQIEFRNMESRESQI